MNNSGTWLLVIDLAKVSKTLMAHRGKKQTPQQVLNWLKLVGMRWMGENAFIATGMAKSCLVASQIIEQHRIG